MKVLYDHMPQLFFREGSLLRIFHSFVSVEITANDVTVEKFEGYNVDVDGPADYGSIVSAIVKGEYPDARKDAILFNRELVKDNPEHEKYAQYIEEYEQFQAWRLQAKQIAAQIVSE